MYLILRSSFHQNQKASMIFCCLECTVPGELNVSHSKAFLSSMPKGIDVFLSLLSCILLVACRTMPDAANNVQSCSSDIHHSVGSSPFTPSYGQSASNQGQQMSSYGTCTTRKGQ